MIPDGATIWARKTLDSEIFRKADKWFKIWFYLVNRANHKDKGRFKRGQCWLSYELITMATGATKDQIKHCIKYMKDEGMLATQKATRGFYITIANYDTYQDLNNYESHTESHTKATQKPHRSHTINKNVRMKECKKKNICSMDFDKFWELYPKKKAKQDAAKAWNKLEHSEPLLSKIMSSVAAHKETHDWQKEGGQYIPLPATFLNGRRWMDQIEVFEKKLDFKESVDKEMERRDAQGTM